MAKEIALTRGLVAVVDDEEFAELSKYRWHATHGKITYAGRKEYIVGGKGKSKFVYMHRYLLKPMGRLQVDHINGDGLDNRRQNLRICTCQENIRNQERKKHLIYKGVRLARRGTRTYWTSQIYVSGKGIHLGYFPTAEDAAHRYNEAAREFFGECARFNLIPAG